MAEHGYKAVYDYVELTVERDGDRWRLILRDQRHGETVEGDETFDTVADAQDAALAFAHRHINVQHNDTLLAKSVLSWTQY